MTRVFLEQSHKVAALFLMMGLGTLCLTPAYSQTEPKIKIGFSAEAMKGERWQTDVNSFKARAKQLGAEVVAADADGNDDLQFQQIGDMIKAGIQVLVLLPRDTRKASRMVDLAKSANVKVLSYDRLVENSRVDLYVSFDRVAMGRMQAEYLVERASSGNYVLIAGSPNDEGARILHDEQMQILQPYIDRGEIQVVSDTYTDDWAPAGAYVEMLSALEATKGDVTAVIASNDGMAAGAIQALKEHDLAGKALVSGQDADLAAVISVAQGLQAMTIYKSITAEAAMAAEQAVHLAKGEKTDANGGLSQGTILVPAILMMPTLVDKNNIKATVVKSGFQKLSEINQALPPEQRIK